MEMIEFMQGRVRVAVNPAHVVRIWDNGNTTEITLVTDVKLIVEEAFDELSPSFVQRISPHTLCEAPCWAGLFAFEAPLPGYWGYRNRAPYPRRLPG